MQFPFLWIGALVAAAFLTFTFTLFGLAMKFLNRAATELRGSILPGLVDGIRDWAGEYRPSVLRIISPGFDEDVSKAARLEPVHRTR